MAKALALTDATFHSPRLRVAFFADPWGNLFKVIQTIGQ